MRPLTRRQILRVVAAAGGLRAAATVGAADPYDGWFGADARGGGTANYDGSTVDRRGQVSTTVRVGAEGNGGPFAFAPPALRVDPGTTVAFQWVSDSETLAVEQQPSGADWSGVETAQDEGFVHQHTFEVAGVYKYYSTPHLSLGMKGALAVGDVDVGESTAPSTVTVTLIPFDGGDRVPGVEVTVSWGTNGSATVETASNGKALVDVPGGATVTIHVSDDAYARAAPADKYVYTVDSDTELAFPVEPATETATSRATTETATSRTTTDTTPSRTATTEPDPTTLSAAPPSPDSPRTTAQPAGEGGLGLMPVVLAGLGGLGGAAWLVRQRGHSDDSGDAKAKPPAGGSSEGTAGQVIVHAEHAEWRVPTTIPRAPSVAVEYDDLTGREPIGSGNSADVHRVRCPTPGGEVTLALKTPRLAGTLHAEQVERLLAEAETWAKLDDHDHVVGVVDYDSRPVPWIAMEYMDAGHLGERAGDLSLAQALWTAIAITKGVHHAHRRGVAHLDLKPENILFRSTDGWDVPKVADWGLSKHLLDHSDSVDGLSPTYAAPEQFDGEHGPTDQITDVYQLGAVLYELFTGRPPVEGEPAAVMRAVLTERPDPPSDHADLPGPLDEVILKALATERTDRYESVLLLRNDLQALVDQG